MKDVLVEVKFKTGSNKKYLCYKEVCEGSKVKVTGAKSGEIGVVVALSNIGKGHYETVTEVLADDVEIDFTVETTVSPKGPKNYFVYKYLWNTKNDSDYGVAIFNEEELTAFWDLDIAMADVLLQKMEMNFEECLYPYEDKLINIFYLTIVRYLIRNYSFDQMIVKNYIDELIQRGWSFAKYKSNILSVISMLIHMRKDNTNLQELYSMIKNMIDKEKEFEIYEFESLSGKKFEPKVQEKINYVLSRVLFWYPDKVIESLNKNHRKFAEDTLVRTRRLAGYPDDNKVFFEDFGFTYINKNLVRKEQNLQKEGLKNILTTDERLSRYYLNSSSKKILLNDETIFISEFKEIFNSVIKEKGLDYTLEDVYKIFDSEELNSLIDFSNKNGKVYYIPCGENNKRYLEYMKLPVWDGDKGIYNRSIEEKVKESPITSSTESFVLKADVVEEIMDELYNSSKQVANVFKGREEYLYHPDIFTASALHFEERSTKGKLWQILDYSCFNEVRVALYFLSLGVEIGQIFPDAVIKKARDYDEKYLSNDQDLLFYNGLNGLSVDESKLLNYNFDCWFTTPVNKTIYKVFSVEKEMIDYVYALFNEHNSYLMTETYGTCNIKHRIPVNKMVYLHGRNDNVHVENITLNVRSENVGVPLNPSTPLKFKFSFVMDGIKEEADRYVFLCHYGILPNEEAEFVLLDPKENSFDEAFQKAYPIAYPDGKIP